jgi:hypothetical protein
VDGEGAPLLGVKVWAAGQSTIARRGRYEFDGLGEEPIEIVASRDGFRSARLEGVRARRGGVELPRLILVEEASEASEGTEAPSGPHSIEGVVLDERGLPRLRASVGCEGPGGEAKHARTGLNGRFRFSGLGPGSYRLRGPSIYKPYVYDPVAADAGSADVVLRPRLGATIGGRVVGIEPGDGPFHVRADIGSFYSARTDDEGRFVIEGLPDGRYTIVIECEGWFLDPVKGVEAGTKDLEIRAEVPPVYAPAWMRALVVSCFARRSGAESGEAQLAANSTGVRYPSAPWGRS